MNREAYFEMARIQSSHWWYTARREILRVHISALQLPHDAEILEVGSGTGANLELLADFGNVTGFEMRQEAIVLASAVQSRDPGRIHLRQGQCPEDLADLPQRFDLICLFDVLEHIRDDADALASLIALLEPGGRLMITVPAYQWMWSPHDEHVHHQRRYDMGGLARACNTAGLKVTRMTHFNTLLFPIAVLARLADKASGSRHSGAAQMPPAALNSIFAHVFGWERHLLRALRFPFGLSLLAVAQTQR